MICIISVILTVVLTVSLICIKGFDAEAAMSGETVDDMFTAADLDVLWNTASATKIALSDEGSAIEGSGAYVHEGDVHIAYGGRYVLTGCLSNGSVIIEADKSDRVWLLLDGVTIHSDDDAPIRVEQADKVFLTLADNTGSAVSSGAQYNEEAVSRKVDGVIYSRDDLTINGTGSLAVEAEYKHGIVCNDNLVITGGDITISAAQDGIHANDSVRIRDAGIAISAGDDGITVSNDDETAFLYVESGDISVTDCYEGLEAVDITIAGGKIDIMSTDDGINAGGSGKNDVIRITGGDVRIVNPSGQDADGLDSNGSIYIEGGKVFISVSDGGGNCALDYGSENGGECVVKGGIVVACGGSAMAEGFDSASPQGFMMYSTAAQAGTEISLEDADGRELLREEIPCSFSSVVLSTPELGIGDVCKIKVGEEEEQITIDNVQASGFAPVGMFPGGKGNEENRGGVRPPDRMDGMEGGRPPEMPDKSGIREGEAKPFGTDTELPQRGGDHFQEQRQTPPGESGSASGISAETWINIGTSVLALLVGLFIAGKVKH